MSAIQDISTRLDAFPSLIRGAKQSQGLTIDQLADRSGVSASTISKITTGVQMDPKLSSAAALCLALGLSMDDALGLVKATGSEAQLQQRVHDLELDNAQLSAEADSLRAVSAIQTDRVAALKTSSYFLGALCLTLAFLLTGYLVGDAQYPNIGLVQQGALSPLGWLIVAIIAVAISATAVLVARAIRHGSGK